MYTHTYTHTHTHTHTHLLYKIYMNICIEDACKKRDLVSYTMICIHTNTHTHTHKHTYIHAAFKIVSDDEDSGPMTESKYQQTQKENAELRGLVQHVSTQLRDLQALSQKVAYLQECRYVRSSPCMCGSGVSLQLQVASLLIWCT